MPITGRTLMDDGIPIQGTGFTYEEGGVIHGFLSNRVGSIASHPEYGVWSGVLPAAAEDDKNVGFSIIEAGYEGPPPHFHTVSTEVFEVKQGTFVFELDGIEYRVSQGETVTVEPHTTHSFRCIGDEYGVMKTTITPSGKISEVIPALLGLAHEDGLEEGIWHGIAVWDELADDTVFVTPPPSITEPLASLLRPVANAQGYNPTAEKYQKASFWEQHVEQPDIPPAVSAAETEYKP